MHKNRGTSLVIVAVLLFGAMTIAAGTAPLGAAEPEFGYPVGGEPWYFVKCGFAIPKVPAGREGSTWSVGRVTVDGARIRDFIVYQGGREVDKNGLKDAAGRLAFDIKARFAWRPNTKSEMRLELVEAKSGKKEYIEAGLQSPAGQGYWDPAWKNYLSLLLSEEHGFERTGYPVHATVGVLANYLRSPDEIRVVRAERKGADIVYREIPSQVYDVRPPGTTRRSWPSRTRTRRRANGSSATTRRPRSASRSWPTSTRARRPPTSFFTTIPGARKPVYQDRPQA